MWRGRCRGKLFWRKVSPGPLSKDFEQGVGLRVAGLVYRCGGAVKGFVRSTIGDPDLRSPSGFDSGLSPSAQDDTAGEVWQRKLEFTLEFRRYFFSLKLIKKPSPVGEGGPRQWWMRSPREKLTYTRHLIRQPAAATFSHWRRLSFVCAFFVNKYGRLCFRMDAKSAFVSS